MPDALMYNIENNEEIINIFNDVQKFLTVEAL